MIKNKIFQENKYLDLKKIIPIDLCRIVTRYALLKEKFSYEPEIGNNAQVLNAHSVYGDTLIETILLFLHPHIEKYTDSELCPTYSYYRVYRPGMELTRHRDRPSCEISATVCFGYNYTQVDDNFRWGMYVHSNNNEKLIQQNPGDVIIYKGCEIDHWRDPFVCGRDSYQVQAFFHYIDKNGPFYPEYAYDKRPEIGYLNKIDK